MHLYTSQTLSQRQSMVVTAQLQQAIQLLQMGNADLQSFIEGQAEENPFVELGLPRSAQRVKSSEPALPSSRRAGGEDDWDRLGNLAADPGPSLYAHAQAHVARLDLTGAERVLAELMLDALEPSGWLGQPLDLLAARAGMPLDMAEALLDRLQKIEPAGLFARNLSECLRLQAAEQGLLTSMFATLLQHLPMLAVADLRGLCRVCACDMDTLKAMLRQIRSLNPKPGALFEFESTAQRPPDLIVTRGTDGWRVDLNRSTLPSVVVKADEARKVARKGEVGLCGTCMDARGLRDDELIEGARRGTLAQLADWTVEADKVLVF